MPAGNEVSLIGNLTKDPALKFLPSGQAVAEFSIACSKRWQDRQTQEWKEATSFFDVKAFGDLAEHTSESLQRGNRVTVLGRLEQRSWETPEGDKRSKVEVVADEVAASLRFANVEIQRIERSAASEGMSAAD